MNLVTPDSGLLFWMILIFGIVFFLLWKFGFPVITGMVERRGDYIRTSLRHAAEAEEKLARLGEEQARLIEQARQEQGRILKEAAHTRDEMLARARSDAQEETQRMVEHARVQIQAERETALRDIRRQVALLSVEVAEKVLRKDLEQTPEQLSLLERMVDEATHAKDN
ncbi:MAG: F0F1 ATP synthase subunit B [Bacteroidales bacterium]|nr:F0F1 ATP synthase subunit B [Bacteroidales bacterium]